MNVPAKYPWSNAFQDRPGFLPGRRLCGDAEYVRGLDHGASQFQTHQPRAVFHSLRGSVPRHAALSSRNFRCHPSLDDDYYDDNYDDHCAHYHYDARPHDLNVNYNNDDHNDTTQSSDDAGVREIRDQDHPRQLRLAF